jgi:hypothetical protein
MPAARREPMRLGSRSGGPCGRRPSATAKPWWAEPTKLMLTLLVAAYSPLFEAASWGEPASTQTRVQHHPQFPARTPGAAPQAQGGARPYRLLHGGCPGEHRRGGGSFRSAGGIRARASA